ncbi:hypothetical protein CARUB_v10005943mg [Capsella rubella]|uniref:Uncharacterized protein n=1 Tax=Capsella rubella TaxID=81985 RepID=R0F6X0_9BRAS|nr:uncharacterized protein LOC17880912 [Capsella rubella]EOA17582.1 hypothetical protein CARUB_v10005943mg [Capsella rubella]
MSKKKETKLSKYMKVPINMLAKARNLYIRGMNQLSSHELIGSSGLGFGVPVCQVSALPRSFSASHSLYSSRAEDSHVAELVRAASARNMSLDAWQGPPKLRKAQSSRTCGGVGGHQEIERIDETSPLITFGSNHKMLPRSKSYGVAKYTHAIK